MSSNGSQQRAAENVFKMMATDYPATDKWNQIMLMGFHLKKKGV